MIGIRAKGTTDSDRSPVAYKKVSFSFSNACVVVVVASLGTFLARRSFDREGGQSAFPIDMCAACSSAEVRVLDCGGDG